MVKSSLFVPRKKLYIMIHYSLHQFFFSLSPNFVLFYWEGGGREVFSCCSPLFCFCCLLLDFNTASSLLSLSVIMAHWVFCFFCVCSCIWAWASWYMYFKHFCLGFLLKELAFWIDLTLQSINDLICLKRCFQSNILWTCMLLHCTNAGWLALLFIRGFLFLLLAVKTKLTQHPNNGKRYWVEVRFLFLLHDITKI